VSGLLLPTKIHGNIHRIGIDFKTIQYFGLDIDSVQERYEPSNNHLQPIQKMANDNPGLKRIVDYLLYHRIEIDSVLAKVGNEPFWNFILEELNSLFPVRNYNRAIEMPEFFLPKEIESLLDKLKTKLSKITLEERQKIKKELEFTKGFIDNIEKKSKDIEERIKAVISNDNDVENLMSEITKLSI